MLTVYGHPLSSPSNKVRMTANAAGVDYEFVLIDLAKNEQKSQEYLAINPVAQIPAIDDDGFRLFESNAIARYLARRSKPDLYPDGPASQAIVDQWIELSGNLVNAGMTRLLYNRIIAPQLNAPVNEMAIHEGHEMLERGFPVIERQLEEHEHLAGEMLTIADIALLASLDPVEMLEVDLSPYPKLGAWRELLRQEDFYTRVHSYYGEGMLE